MWVVGLFLAAGIGGAALVWRAVAPGTLKASIAVLPFLSSGPNDEYLSDGLTDEITDQLARMDTLRVIAHESAFKSKGKPVDIHEAGRLLNVTSLLTGQVSREGDRLKIVVQLKRVADGSTLWSQTYDRLLPEVIAIPAEVAAQIASNLSVSHPSLRSPVARDWETEDHYLHARYDAQRFSADSLNSAIGEYQQALKLDPGYAAAWLGISSARLRALNFQAPPDGIDPGIAAGFRKALELDSGLVDAHAGLALLALRYQADWTPAQQEVQAALVTGSSASAEQLDAFILMNQGSFDQAEYHFRRALDFDPLSTDIVMNSAQLQFCLGRFRAARAGWERLPDVPVAQMLAAYALVWEGQPSQALERLHALGSTSPAIPLFEATAQAQMGNRAAAVELLRNAEESYVKSGLPLYWMAFARASVNDDDATMQWLQKSAAQREAQIIYMGIDPAFMRLRTQPAFRELKAKIGLPE